MCDFIARTNWSKIKSNYFVNTITIFNLSYCTNITSTVTFVNHSTLCRAFLFFSLKYHPHKSCTIFHIDLYVFYIHTEISNGTNKLNHIKRLAVFQNEPFAIPYGRMNHCCHHWISLCSPLFIAPFTAVVLNGFLLFMKGLLSTTRLLFSSFFFKLGVTNNAAKPNCVLPIGEDGSSYDDCSSDKLIVININETQLSWKQQSCQ